MFFAPSRTTSERGKPCFAQRLTSFSRHRSSVTSRLSLVSNQATSRRVSLRSGLAAAEQRRLGVGLLEIVGDRLAVADRAVRRRPGPGTSEAGLSRRSSSGCAQGWTSTSSTPRPFSRSAMRTLRENGHKGTWSRRNMAGRVGSWRVGGAGRAVESPSPRRAQGRAAAQMPAYIRPGLRMPFGIEAALDPLGECAQAAAAAARTGRPRRAGSGCPHQGGVAAAAFQGGADGLGLAGPFRLDRQPDEAAGPVEQALVGELERSRRRARPRRSAAATGARAGGRGSAGRRRGSRARAWPCRRGRARRTRRPGGRAGG